LPVCNHKRRRFARLFLPLFWLISVEVYPLQPAAVRRASTAACEAFRGLSIQECRSQDFAANTAKPGASPTPYLNALPGVAYLGSKACALCHQDIYASFEKTNMARALSLPMPLVAAGKLPVPLTVFDNKLDLYYRVYADPSGLYQSVYRYGQDGKTVYRETEKISYAIGSGRNGIGFLVQKGSFLFQAPLAFYPRDNTWGLSPGYEAQDYGFTRPITAECVTCHSGIPRPVRARPGMFESPCFREMGIGCENCHGPGQLHMAQRQQGSPLTGIDRTIVNPARLPTRLGNDICIFCHEAGDARVLRSGKNFLDFRPGTPLEDTVAVIDANQSHRVGPAVPLVGYSFQLQLSRCYRESGNWLKCITCHDPHVQPAPTETAAYFRRKCLQCHTEQSCRQTLAARLQAKAPDDCISCHMATRPALKFTHTIVTDHRIVARPDEPYPEAPRSHAKESPNGVIFADGLANQDALTPLVRFQAYGQLLTAHPDDAQYQERYRELQAELAMTHPDNPDVLRSLAGAEAEEGTPEGLQIAVTDLQKALSRGADSPHDRLWLAQMLLRLGRKQEAEKQLQHAISLWPYNPDYYRYLAVTFISDGKYREGMDVIDRALQVFPERDDVRALREKAKNLGSSCAIQVK
jgi:tetratricopeptide (TPR) repeat protein